MIKTRYACRDVIFNKIFNLIFVYICSILSLHPDIIAMNILYLEGTFNIHESALIVIAHPFNTPKTLVSWSRRIILI